MTTAVVLTRPELGPPPNEAALSELVELRYATAAELPGAIAGAEVCFLWDFFSPALRAAWPRADRLAWVHVAAAGVDAILFDELRDSSVVLTNAAGFFDQPIAEFVAAQVLAETKQLYLNAELQSERRWEHRETYRVGGRRALVVGTGGIGRACARLLRALGMEVRGVGRVARAEDPDFGEVVASDDLAAAVDGVDHLVLAAPLTAGTRGMVDARVLAALPSGAQLINIGRGELIDEAALITELARGRICAALDVFAVEPLPAESPLWAMPNVRVSPHLSGDVRGWRTGLAEQFEANLRRWLAGEPLAGVVDKAAGYVRRDPR